MTGGIIISTCILILLAYVFDFSSKKTKIPSVILLLALGWSVRQLTVLAGVRLPDLSAILPLLGTIGLILIVLEGSLELELDRSRLSLIKKSTLAALLPFIALALMIAGALWYYSEGTYSFKRCLANAIPLCVISSAIAIPTVKNMGTFNREFVTYESSLSDIIGVILFNFILLNEYFGFLTFGNFFLQILLIFVVSFISTIGLSFLLRKIGHHIKFAPIIVLIILIYTVAKEYHLPALVFILIFGMFLGNMENLKHFHWMQRFRPEILGNEVRKFKDLNGEATFLIRSLFFMLFGYLIETHEVVKVDTLPWSFGIVAAIFLTRYLTLKFLKLDVTPLVFIAPRGLITILLFLSIPLAHQHPLVNKSLILQIILLTAFIMMTGLLAGKRPPKDSSRKVPESVPAEEGEKTLVS